MPRIPRVPFATEKDIEPGTEIHRIGIDRNANVSKIAGAVTGRDVHAATQRDSQMGEIAAHPDTLIVPFGRSPVAARMRVTKLDSVVRVFGNCLHS